MGSAWCSRKLLMPFIQLLFEFRDRPFRSGDVRAKPSPIS
jgi:hypothetical protein